MANLRKRIYSKDPLTKKLKKEFRGGIVFEKGESLSDSYDLSLKILRRFSLNDVLMVIRDFYSIKDYKTYISSSENALLLEKRNPQDIDLKILSFDCNYDCVHLCLKTIY